LGSPPVATEDTYFAEKARQCSRLAEKIVNCSDPAIVALLKLAIEYEAEAAALRREFASTGIAC
jgi:hypothetical protein